MPGRMIRWIEVDCGMAALIAAAAIWSVAADRTNCVALRAGTLPALTIWAETVPRICALLLGNAKVALAMLDVVAGVHVGILTA